MPGTLKSRNNDGLGLSNDGMTAHKKGKAQLDVAAHTTSSPPPKAAKVGSAGSSRAATTST